jgi:hypothetical protein
MLSGHVIHDHGRTQTARACWPSIKIAARAKQICDFQGASSLHLEVSKARFSNLNKDMVGKTVEGDSPRIVFPMLDSEQDRRPHAQQGQGRVRRSRCADPARTIAGWMAELAG